MAPNVGIVNSKSENSRTGYQQCSMCHISNTSAHYKEVMKKLIKMAPNRGLYKIFLYFRENFEICDRHCKYF